MALNERTRHALYEAMRQAVGDEPAETLMEMLPPVGWADVATKHDLAALQATLEARMEAEVAKGINRLLMWLVPLLAAYGAALVRFG